MENKILKFIVVTVVGLVSLIFLSVFGLFGFSVFMNVSGMNQRYAQEQFTDFLKDTNLKAKKCSGDSDGNGYARCPAYNPSTEEFLQFECATPFSGNSGCQKLKNLEVLK